VNGDAEPTLLERVIAQDSALLELYRITVVDSGDGACTLSATPRPELVNSAGVTHGSLAFTLADTAAAYAMASRGLYALTINAAISYAGPARQEEILTARASIKTAGRRLAAVQAEVHSATRLVAHGTFQFSILQSR
jgi:acyl-CoA thioesterase